MPRNTKCQNQSRIKRRKVIGRGNEYPENREDFQPPGRQCTDFNSDRRIVKTNHVHNPCHKLFEGEKIAQMLRSQGFMFKNILAAGRDEGGGAHQDKGVGANTGQVMEVNQNIEKDDGNLEDLSDNVATKDSGEADRHRLGEVDEISNNVTDFYVLSINPRRNLLQFHCYR